jgi:saccharopine dehydrogenase (NADP+, L-glutamate forming)
MERIRSTGILEETKIGITNASPARVLQHLLEQKWVLKPGDKDMIVMQHIFDYTIDNKAKRLTSSLVVKGENTIHTAMAKTVGLPLAIAALLLIEGKLKSKGVQLPVMEEMYVPILKELQSIGIEFVEKEIDLS